MTEQTPETDDEKRIREWREERARVAQAEKQDRIEQQKAERAKEDAAQADIRAAEVEKLVPTQHDMDRTAAKISRYHSKKRRFFVAQFAMTVLAPLLAYFIYITLVAVPLYEARAVIAITKPATEQENGIGGILGSLQGPANLQEVFMADEFVRSDALLDHLEAKLNLISRLSSDEMDPLRRLHDFQFIPFPVRQQFTRFVESSINIQSGLLTIYVRMPKAEEAIEISSRVIDRTAQQINDLSADIFDRRVQLAESAASDAQDGLEQAQLTVVELQIESGEANPSIRIESIYTTIRELTAEAQSLTSDIDRAQIAGSGNIYEVDRLTELRASLNQRIEAQRALLISDPKYGEMSLNSLLTRYELAILGVRIAEQRLTASIEGLSNARQSAALGQSIFQVVVPPTVAARPAFPNIPANLFIALFIALAAFALVRMIMPGRQTF